MTDTLPSLADFPKPVTPQEKREFYETFLAPALLEMAKIAHSNGLSFASLVEWNPLDSMGATFLFQDNASVGMKTMKALMERDMDYMARQLGSPRLPGVPG